MEVGGLRVASIVDRIDGPSSWTIERDVHALILYEAGSYHWLETWQDDQRTSLGDPLPGEMWLVPAGRRYRAAAKGGAVRTIEVEIPVAKLTVAPGTRALAAYQDIALAALVRALLAGDAAAADPLLATLDETLAAMAGRPDSPAIVQRINDLYTDPAGVLPLWQDADANPVDAGLDERFRFVPDDGALDGVAQIVTLRPGPGAKPPDPHHAGSDHVPQPAPAEELPAVECRWRPVRPLPNPDEPFEVVWRGYLADRNVH